MIFLGSSDFFEEGSSEFLQNGRILCEITRTDKLIFYRVDENGARKELLQEYQRTRGMSEEGRKEFNSALEIEPRTFVSYEGMDNYRLYARFEAEEDEKLFGVGQYQQPYLNIKGCTLELAQSDSQAIFGRFCTNTTRNSSRCLHYQSSEIYQFHNDSFLQRAV